MSDVTLNDFHGTMLAMTKAMNRLADELAAARGAGSAAGGSTGKASGGTKSSSKSGPTLEDVKKEFTAFLSVGDKELKEERGAWLKKLTKKFGVTRITEVEGEDIAKALSELKKRLAAEKEAEDTSGDDGDSEEESII